MNIILVIDVSLLILFICEFISNWSHEQQSYINVNVSIKSIHIYITL